MSDYSDSDCRHTNFSRRFKCNRSHRERSPKSSEVLCRMSKAAQKSHSDYGSGGGSSAKKRLGTEIGKAAAEKSRGLFSAEDWQCSKCANINWSRRQNCNLCNSPKFCNIEERTGYGGGYNDRGIVEYKERSESDGEYDEYGRLKKRKKPNNVRHSKDADRRNDPQDKSGTFGISTVPGASDEEEEGDEDLSKYDLWGDVDNDDNKKLKTKKKSPNESMNRNTSRSSSSASSEGSSSTRNSTTSSETRSKSDHSRSSFSASKRNQRHSTNHCSRSNDKKNMSHGTRNSCLSQKQCPRERKASQANTRYSHSSIARKRQASKSPSRCSSANSTKSKSRTDILSTPPKKYSHSASVRHRRH